VASDAGRLAGAELSCQKKLANKNATAADDAAAPTPTPAAAAAAAAPVDLVVVAAAAPVDLVVVVTTATSAATNLYGGVAPMAIDSSTSVSSFLVCLMEAVSTAFSAPFAARLLLHVIVVAVPAGITASAIIQVKIPVVLTAVHVSVFAVTSVVQVVAASAAQIAAVMTILLVRAPSDAYVARNLTLSGVSPVTYVDGIHVASVMAPPFAVPTTANATRTRKDFIVLNARTMEMERG